MYRGLEILELRTDTGEYVHARVALDGRLVIPFDIPKSTYVDDFPRQEDFESYLVRQAQTLLDTYGDAREGRQEPEFLA